MKEKYKIYLIFWGPCVVLFLSFLIYLLFTKKQLESDLYRAITLSSTYIEIIHEFNNLRYLTPLKLTERYTINKDPFLLPFQDFPKSSSLYTSSYTFVEKPKMTLNMIYIEGKNKKCVINGGVFAEKSKINKDIKVLKIGDYYVDLQVKGQTKRVFLGATVSF
ncbi:hypothetical protein [Thermodesulfobacterium hveragerdense]|uniref:hypothetical protein n=1 Tax=Thermodesulfobacterium hveragerdense TaxID=53424 RepID=UPI00048C9F0A|nr:hypothetical protein [Thermodesulfobacterium hveragerdense]